MLRRIAAAARALIHPILHRKHYFTRAQRRRSDALRDATSAVCQQLERRLQLTAIDPISDQSTSEGSTISIATTVHVDPGCEADVYAGWGDGNSDSLRFGSGDYPVAFDHLYAHHGTYAAHVSVIDSNNNSDDANFTVNVGDVPPDLRLGGNDFALRNVNYDLTLYNYDPGNDPLDRWHIVW